MENLQLELVYPGKDGRERFLERQCEGLQFDVLSPVIMRTGREIYQPELVTGKHAFIACLATEHREIQAFARFMPTQTLATDNTIEPDGMDCLTWCGTAALEITALVVNRCPFDNDEAQLDWRRTLLNDLLTRMEAQLERSNINKLLLMTERAYLPAFERCPYPNKRLHMPQAQFDRLYFGFRVSCLDRSEYAKPLTQAAYALRLEASQSLSRW